MPNALRSPFTSSKLTFQSEISFNISFCPDCRSLSISARSTSTIGLVMIFMFCLNLFILSAHPLILNQYYQVNLLVEKQIVMQQLWLLQNILLNVFLS